MSAEDVRRCVARNGVRAKYEWPTATLRRLEAVAPRPIVSPGRRVRAHAKRRRRAPRRRADRRALAATLALARARGVPVSASVSRRRSDGWTRRPNRSSCASDWFRFRRRIRTARTHDHRLVSRALCRRSSSESWRSASWRDAGAEPPAATCELRRGAHCASCRRRRAARCAAVTLAAARTAHRDARMRSGRSCRDTQRFARPGAGWRAVGGAGARRRRAARRARSPTPAPPRCEEQAAAAAETPPAVDDGRAALAAAPYPTWSGADADARRPPPRRRRRHRRRDRRAGGARRARRTRVARARRVAVEGTTLDRV